MKTLNNKMHVKFLTVIVTFAALLFLEVSHATPQVGPTVKCELVKHDIWPPNHKLVDVGLTITVTGCTPTSTNVTVYSNQDDVDTTSTANFSPDARYANGKLELRAERSGNLAYPAETDDARVYVIVVTVTDCLGNQATDCCTAVLPHARSDAFVTSADMQAEKPERSVPRSLPATMKWVKLALRSLDPSSKDRYFLA